MRMWAKRLYAKLQDSLDAACLTCLTGPATEKSVQLVPCNIYWYSSVLVECTMCRVFCSLTEAVLGGTHACIIVS